MLQSAEEWEHLENSEETACNASAEAAQLCLNQRQFRPAFAHVRDSIKFFVAKTFYQVNAQPEIHEKVRLNHIAKPRY
jgi:hypothetical protein